MIQARLVVEDRGQARTENHDSMFIDRRPHQSKSKSYNMKSHDETCFQRQDKIQTLPQTTTTMADIQHYLVRRSLRTSIEDQYIKDRSKRHTTNFHPFLDLKLNMKQLEISRFPSSRIGVSVRKHGRIPKNPSRPSNDAQNTRAQESLF